MIPFNKLQSVMTKLRFKDDTALRNLGLTKLLKVYDAYPLQEGGSRLYCLLPKGLNPQAAQKLAVEAAINQIVVLEHVDSGVTKVWPHKEAANQPAAASEPTAETKKKQGDGSADYSIEIVEE